MGYLTGSRDHRVPAPQLTTLCQVTSETSHTARHVCGDGEQGASAVSTPVFRPESTIPSSFVPVTSATTLRLERPQQREQAHIPSKLRVKVSWPQCVVRQDVGSTPATKKAACDLRLWSGKERARKPGDRHTRVQGPAWSLCLKPLPVSLWASSPPGHAHLSGLQLCHLLGSLPRSPSRSRGLQVRVPILTVFGEPPRLSSSVTWERCRLNVASAETSRSQ